MTMIIRRTVPMTMGRTVALKTKRYELRGMKRNATAMTKKMRMMERNMLGRKKRMMKSKTRIMG